MPRTLRFSIDAADSTYETSNSLGYLERAYGDTNPIPNYETFRADTFHQFTMPETFFGWLNVVPKCGFPRDVLFSHSAPSNTGAYDLQLADNRTSPTPRCSRCRVQDLDPLSRPSTRRNCATPSARSSRRATSCGRSLDAGVETSFKLSRQYDNVETRAFGLDALQHIIQPYVDFEEIEDFGVGSRKLLQFDRLLPTTQLQPIDFPQFNSIDTIDEQTAVRLGVRNRLQTKRDALHLRLAGTGHLFPGQHLRAARQQAFVNDGLDACPTCSISSRSVRCRG